MKPNQPVGFAALLEKMPRRFVAQAKRVEERARRRREAQARRFEDAFGVVARPKAGVEHEEWQDTVAQFTVKQGEDHGAA